MVLTSAQKSAGTVTTNPKYKTYSRGEGITKTPKYNTYQKTQTTNQTLQNSGVSEFNTTGGKIGTATSAVSEIRQGKKSDNGVTIAAQSKSKLVQVSPGVAEKLIFNNMGGSIPQNSTYYARPQSTFIQEGERRILNPKVFYPQSVQKSENGRIQNGTSNRWNDFNSNFNAIGQNIEKNPRLSGFINVIKSPFLGAAKTLYFSNYFPNSNSTPLVNFGQNKYFKTNLMTDPDVKNFGFSGAFVIGTYAYPAIEAPLLVGFAYDTLKKGSKAFFTKNEYEQGQALGQSALLFGIPFARKEVEVFKGEYVKFKSEYIPPEKVFAESVLSGKERMPTTKSISEALARFNAGKKGSSILIQTLVGFAYDTLKKGNKAFFTKNEYEQGQALGQSALLFGIPFARKEVEVFKGEYVKFKSEYIPPEKVFAESVLSGKERMPTTKSISEALARFNAGKKGSSILVQTSSSNKLSSDMVIDLNKRYEDPGIYVTPIGEGSPYFLRVSPEINYESSSFNLNPFADIFKFPTVTTFKVSGVEQYPRNIISQPGFDAIAKYQSDILSQRGSVVITKRSELGQGNIPIDYSIPKIGRYGTSEIEAVVPISSIFKYSFKSNGFISRFKGFESYTMFENKPIAIRNTELIFGSPKKLKMSGLLSDKKSGADILSENTYLSSYLKSSSKRGGSFSILNYGGYSSSKSKSSSVGNLLSLSSYKSGRSDLFSSSFVSSGSSESSSFKENYYFGNSSVKNNNFSSYSPLNSKKVSLFNLGYSSKKVSKNNILNISFPIKSNKNYGYFNDQKKISKKNKIEKSKRVASRLKSPDFYVLPDLRSVSITEALTGREAVSPRLTKGVRKLAFGAFSGQTTGFIPTEQMRVSNKLFKFSRGGLW